MRDINDLIEQTAKHVSRPEDLVKQVLRFYYNDLRSSLQDKQVTVVNIGGFGVFRFNHNLTASFIRIKSRITEELETRLRHNKLSPKSRLIYYERINNNIEDIDKVYNQYEQFREKTKHINKYRKLLSKVEYDLEGLSQLNPLPKYLPGKFKANRIPEGNMPELPEQGEIF